MEKFCKRTFFEIPADHAENQGPQRVMRRNNVVRESGLHCIFGQALKHIVIFSASKYEDRSVKFRKENEIQATVKSEGIWLTATDNWAGMPSASHPEPKPESVEAQPKKLKRNLIISGLV